MWFTNTLSSQSGALMWGRSRGSEKKRAAPLTTVTILLLYGNQMFQTVQSINAIALKMVKVSKLVQRKLIPYRSIIGLGAFRKIQYFGDTPNTANVYIGI